MKIKLSDAFRLEMGKTPSRDNKEYWGKGYKWASIADLKDKKTIKETKEQITEKAIHETGIKPVPAGTPIMSFKLSIGKTAITSEEMYTNEAIMAFHDLGRYKVDTNYFYHCLKNTNWSEGTNKAVKGVTLNKAVLSQKVIDLPEYEKQLYIASKMDRLDSLISKKRNEIEILNQIVKSRFIEMFGDSLSNSKGYKLQSYGDVFDLNAGGTPSKNHPEYWTNGNIPWIGSNMCHDTVIYKNDGQFINREGLNHSSARIFPSGTVLIALVGATIGKTALLRFETTTNQNVLGVRKIEDAGYTPEFVFCYTQGLYKKFTDISDGGFSMASKKFISNLPLPVVSEKEQKNFSSFFWKIDKSKHFNTMKEAA